MDRRLPRSPSLKSPVFSPKSPAIYEKYKSGCAWGLIHFFDFRQGHSHGKLISDKKHVNRQAKADGYSRKRPDSLSEEENYKHIDDEPNNMNPVNCKKSKVKKVIEGKMSVMHHTNKNSAIAEMSKPQLKPKLVGHSKNHGKASKNYKKSSRLPAHGCKNASTEGYWQPSNRNMVNKSSNNNLASMTEASGTVVHTNNGGSYSCRSIPSSKLDRHAEINLRVHMNEAVEAFVNQKLTDGENLSKSEVSYRSEDFIDALEILNSNKELFMKLLQDPNSLLVKHIQGLRDSQAKKQPPQSSSNAKASQCQSKETGEHQSSSTIVVLKPGIESCPDRIGNQPLPQSYHSLGKKERAIKAAFLSFEHMKRKLRHAMRTERKEQCHMSHNRVYEPQHDFEQFEVGSKEMSTEADERISAGQSYVDVEEVLKSSHEFNRTEAMGHTDKFHSGIGDQAASSTESCHRTSNLLTIRHPKGTLHPRKDLSEILSGGNEDFSRKQSVRRSVSLAEQVLLPTLTPGRDKGREFSSPQMRFSPYGNFSTPQMRFSPYGNFSTVDRYNWMVQTENKCRCLDTSCFKNLVAQSMSDNGESDDQLQVANRSYSCYLSPANKIALEPNSTNTIQRTEPVNISKESDYFDCSKLDSPLGDKTPSSSTDVYTQRVEDSDSIIDGAEQPSPISVLEQFLAEDNINSPNTISLAAEPPTETSCIDFEEFYPSPLLQSHLNLKISAGSPIKKQESLSKYIRTVVQISGLSWDELSWKWHFSDQMLNSSLFDNAEVWPENSYTDDRLLLDYISEVTLELYQCYFRCSPWVSVLNPKPQQVLLTKNMAHEVLRHVDWLLLSELPQQTLQQLVEKDLNKSWTWMDTQIDTEDAITELVDSILEDLVEDTRV